MSINIKATNLELTTEIDGYLTKKLESLKHIVDFDADNAFAQVELAKTTNHHKTTESMYRAEINYRVDGMNGRVVSENEDLNAAIDEMKDQLAREIKAKQEKDRDDKRHGGAELKQMSREDGEAVADEVDDKYEDVQ
ncbi:MAG: HPF/RaiA family ribosome-associated protein [Patescibacteria group bacterium]